MSAAAATGKGVAFCAASKLALGNFQRVANVAAALAERRPDIPLTLMTNSHRGAEWARRTALYHDIAIAARTTMAESLQRTPPGAVVASTIAIPGLEQVDAPLCLILREVMPDKLAGFRLANGRLWDIVIVPNPADHWMPDQDTVGTKRIEAVGWIYRRPADPAPVPINRDTAAGPPQRPLVLVTSGGGSGDDEHDPLTEEIARLIARLRQAASRVAIDVVHARGPNARPGWSIPGADRTIEPGPALHNLFAQADIVISTAGYNSVLELACTDVPVLLLPIGRYSDDQHQRAREWGPRLGLCHDPEHRERAVRWMAAIVEERRRRPAVDLGPSGAGACAALIESVLA